jgi:glycosyltransferase involved in cell wall biosynthesis
MKILYVYEKMPSTYQKYLSNLLILVKTSLNVKTLTYSKDKSADFVIKTYNITDYFQRIIYKLGLSKHKTLDVKAFHEFDIIHLQHSYLFNKIKALLNDEKRPKIIITLRGGDTYIKPWIDKRWSDFYKDYGNLIDAFITVSQNQKEYLQKWGIKENKIHVIPVSFGNHSNAQPKYPNKEKLKLVSAFRMTWEKNIEGSIKFAKLLKDKNIDFQYDIYGDGKDLGQLYYLVDKYGLNNNIFIKGKIDNEELKEEFANYDFFVQLSVSEALSVSVLEAQSVGLPCVVSNSGGLPEAVINEKTAIVCEYYDIEKIAHKTLEIFNDKGKYFAYSKNAIEFVNDNFTLKHEEEKLTKLYKSLQS